MRKHPELQGLQALRGLAALLVVAHHTAETLARAKYGGQELAGGLFFPLGRAGVDLFFVLSGFIIYYIHRTDIACPVRFWNYAVRRLSRIYPTFWVALAFVTVATLAVHREGGLGSDPAVVIIAKSALLMPFTPPGTENIVGVAWTLSHELLFYAAFSVLILSRRIGLIILAVWLAALLGAQLFPAPPRPLNFLLYVKNIEFFMGMGIAWLLFDARCRAGWTMGFIGVVLFVATAVIELLGGYDFLTAAPSLGYGVGAAAMIFALASLETSITFRVRRPLVLVGAASYSIYLIHFTVVTALVKVAHATGLTARLELLPLFLAIATAATLAGVIMYFAAERHLIRIARRVLMEPSAPRPLVPPAHA